MQNELRKQYDLLVTGGTGVCIFGYWSVIKAVINIILPGSGFWLILNQMELSQLERRLICAVAIVIVFIIFGLHMLVGLSARDEGVNKKKHRAYMPVAVFLSIVYICFIVMDAFSTPTAHITDRVVSVIVDITILFTLVDLIISFVKIKKLNKRLKKKEEI